MTVTISVFDWEKEKFEKVLKKHDYLKAKFSPKKKVLKFATRGDYDMFENIRKNEK